MLYHFTNKALMDTCARVGGDPARKLSNADRLIGSSLLVQKTGAVPAYIAIGAAAGLHRFVAESNMEQAPESAKALLLQTSGLDETNPLVATILDMYKKILEGSTISQLQAFAQAQKAALRRPII